MDRGDAPSVPAKRTVRLPVPAVTSPRGRRTAAPSRRVRVAPSIRGALVDVYA
jgi:hypothetical protein